jgi:N-ethylmaleimide reductase
MTSLFDPGVLGDIAIANRIIMAPMTRSRAGPGDVPNDLHVEYYRQRASAGLIISEGTQPSPTGKGYCRTPGIHDPGQVAAWRRVTDAAHAKGGRMVLQIMHVGRVASQLNKAPGAETIGPSAIRAAGEMFTDQGMVPLDEPRALATEEIPRVIAEFAQAALNARAAGFDGVELHCTSGYLPAQFLSSGSNRRTDLYGGVAANRIRFVVETIEAMAAAVGPGRVGFRICPGNPFNDIHDDDPAETYGLLLETLSPLKLAYLHLIDWPNPQVESLPLAKRCWRGPLILNESITAEHAKTLVGDGVCEAVSFGRPFIGNPDLVSRIRTGAPIAAFDSDTLYTPGPEGYIDYAPYEP